MALYAVWLCYNHTTSAECKTRTKIIAKRYFVRLQCVGKKLPISPLYILETVMETFEICSLYLKNFVAVR